MSSFRSLVAMLITCIAVLFSSMDAKAVSLPGMGGGGSSAETVEKDLYGRDTPKGLIFGYLQAVSSHNYELAGRYLVLPPSTEGFRLARGSKLARDLEILLDRAGSLNDNWTISATPDGNLSDGHPPNYDLLGRIAVGGNTFPLLAERVQTEDGRHIWQISAATVSQIPDLLALSTLSAADRLMPWRVLQVEVFSVPLGHIAYSVMAAFGIFAMISVVLVALYRAGMPLALRHGFDKQLAAVKVVRGPVSAICTALLILPALELSGVSVILRGFISPLIDIAIWISLARIALGVVQALASSAIDRAQRTGHIGSISFLLLARRAAKLTVLFFAILATLSAIGVNLTAGLAALGIGGIAIALGSQKTIEHFVGSVTVVADRVVSIGDFCRFGTTLGTVEDIGIRSTRIRTLDRTLVTIPNGVFSSAEIENYTSRDKFLFRHYLTLRPESSRTQIVFCLEGIREILLEDTFVDPDPRRVRLLGIEQSMPRIEVQAYVHAVDWNEFLMRQEGLVLKILDVIEQSGTALSAPRQDVRVSGHEPRSTDKFRISR